MLFDLYDQLERKSVVLINKYCPETRISKCESPKSLVSRIEKTLKHSVIGAIPCFCDVLQQERADIMAVKDPGHQFVRNLEEVADNLRRMEKVC